MKTFILFFCLFAIAATAQNTNISQGKLFDGEPFLAVNPQNSRHLVVAWMGWKRNEQIVIKTRVSFDGGQNWGEGSNPPHAKPEFTSADPSLAFDNAGNIYLCYVDFTGKNVSPPDGAIYLAKSTDGGKSWNTPVKVLDYHSDPGKKAIDRPWIGIDRSGGTNSGTIYISSMTAKGATEPYHPYLSISRDGGASFEPWRYLDTAGWLVGSVISAPMPTPSVGADGVFYAIYPSYVREQNPLAQYILARSKDGGRHFEYRSVFASSSGVKDRLAKKAYLLRTDPSDARHLAFFYLAAPHGDIDVMMRESFDSGDSWKAAVRVNDDPEANDRMQDMIWADFDQDGDIAVAWRDRRNGNSGSFKNDFEVFGAIKQKGEDGYNRNFPITDRSIPYDKIYEKSGNDFLNTQIAADTVYTVWADTRNGKLNIWFQISDIHGKPLGARQLAEENDTPLKIFPNPVRASQFKVFAPAPIRRILIFNSSGKLVYRKRYLRTQTAELSLELPGLKEGYYFIHLTTKEGKKYRKMINL